MRENNLNTSNPPSVSREEFQRIIDYIIRDYNEQK